MSNIIGRLTPRFTRNQGAASGTMARASSSQTLAGVPDFWRLWMVGLVIFTVRWLETIVIGVFVYRQTGSPFIVAAVTMLRLLPMGFLGAFLGAWAERVDRRLTLIVMVALMLSAWFCQHSRQRYEPR